MRSCLVTVGQDKGCMLVIFLGFQNIGERERPGNRCLSSHSNWIFTDEPHCSTSILWMDSGEITFRESSNLLHAAL